jgi:hypothetical protein
MPKSLRQRLDHDETLADIFEQYEPRDEDRLDASAWRALLAAVEARAEAERDIIAAVNAMRVGNWSWHDIGHLLGTSGQAAQQRYGSRGSLGDATPGGK